MIVKKTAFLLWRKNNKKTTWPAKARSSRELANTIGGLKQYNRSFGWWLRADIIELLSGPSYNLYYRTSQ
jgi:hypothetical protein